eukprot:TRINITY_DN3931_c0_g1_i3.p1 TRINITY_DN3931_c0_g1~~TRINITY_DN3931_c0_g1_i3.p1  ORF type:complete len:683 (+),score=170.64 TRINITY_DN3931_c0_g1_i3:117-2051(+)
MTDSGVYFKCGMPSSQNDIIKSCSRPAIKNCWNIPSNPTNSMSLFSPILDLRSYTNVSVQFNIIWDMDTAYVGVNFGVNLNASANAVDLSGPKGTGFVVYGRQSIYNDPNNWYNRWRSGQENYPIDALGVLTASGLGWSGSDSVSTGEFAHMNLSSNGWQVVKQSLIDGMPSRFGQWVQFRFAYGHSSTMYVGGFEGFAFDEFVVYGDYDPLPSSSSAESTQPSDAVRSSGSSNHTGAIVGGIIGGLAGIAIIAALVFFVIRFRRRSHPDDQPNQMEEGPMGIPMTKIQREKYAELSKELKMEDIEIGKILGQGNFGVVYKGQWQQTTPVALKSVTGEDLSEFLSEAHITKALNHPNCVRFLGLFLQEEKIYIVTEFMARGSLLSLLRAETEVVRSRLIQMAIDICAGMKYLESQKIIHRDLSARNVLVDDHDVVKISDFGMSRMTSGDYYQVTSRVMPVKWTAPEVLTHGKYTFASDVWSFGVVLYEIFTLGAEPYPGMKNEEVVPKVTSGWRMPRPDECPSEIYDLMLKCWNQSDRPSFLEIRKSLETFKDEAAVSIALEDSRKYEEASYDVVDTSAKGKDTYNEPIATNRIVSTKYEEPFIPSPAPTSENTYNKVIEAPPSNSSNVGVTTYEELSSSFKRQ